jgi:hypothetical protein
MRRSVFVYALGSASAIAPLALLALLLAGPAVIQRLGLSLLVVPVIGGVAAVASLIYVYRGRPLNMWDVAWIVAMGLLWFVALPAFWYYKVYGGPICNLTPGCSRRAERAAEPKRSPHNGGT